VLGHGAIEEPDVLRQIADVAAEIVGRPLAQIGAVQSDMAPASRPYSDESLEQRRFACRAAAEQSNGRSGMERERDVRDDNGLAAWWRDSKSFHPQASARTGQSDRPSRCRHVVS